jgi:uncharacterized protein
MKCFYHSADLDGHCSGAIVKHFCPECELIGFNYGQDFPWSSILFGETIFMVDVSLPIHQMVELARISTLIWIDHHVGIIREFNALPDEDQQLFDGRRNTKMAACELCWEWFSPEPVPLVVECLGVYDSWRFLPHDEASVKKFQYGMRMTKETRPEHAMAFWEKLFPLTLHDEAFDQIFFRGATIYDYQLAENEKHCRSCAFETMIWDEAGEEIRCIAVNSSLMNSDVFKSVWDAAKYDVMLCFYWSNRGFWRVSIYSDKPTVDCSVLAKIHGGGGHKGAAGFQCQELPFALTTKDRK